MFNDPRARANQSFVRTKKTFVAVGAALSTLYAPVTFAFNSPQSIETIQVKGQVNSLLLATELDLSASSSPDLRNQLSQLPSVSINGNGRVSGIIQYRGLYSDRVRISVDDVLIIGAGPNAMDSPLSHVIGNLSQQITLHHAIAPVTAGAETLGGAIDISDIEPILSNTDHAEYDGAITIGKYTNDGQSYTGMLRAVTKSTYVTLIADDQKGDNIESGGSAIVANTNYKRNGLKLNTGYKNGAHKLSLFVSQRDTNNSGTPALAMDIEYVDALALGVNYDYEINKKWTLITKIAGNNNEHGMNNFSQRLNPMPSMHRLNTVDSKGRSGLISVKQEDRNWQNEYGIETQSALNNSRITNPNASLFFLQNFNNVSRDLYSIYAQWQQNYDNKNGLLNWQLGTRVSRVSADADEIDTNMAMMNANVRALRDNFNQAQRQQDFSLVDIVTKASFGISQNIKLQASAAIKQKAPSYNQLYSWFPLGVSAGLADGRNYLGNLDLKKENATKVDLGLLIEGSNWLFLPNIYYSKIDDYIIGVSSTNMSANMIANMNNIQIPLQWQNEDATLAGFDFTYRHTINSQFSLSASGQYVRAKQTSGQEQDLYRIAPMSVDIALQYNKDNYNVSFLSRWVASQNKVARQQNETPSTGYAVFDLHAQYQFSQDIELTVFIENLLDKNYADHLAGVNRVTSSDIVQGAKLPSAGRNIGVYLSYQF